MSTEELFKIEKATEDDLSQDRNGGVLKAMQDTIDKLEPLQKFKVNKSQAQMAMQYIKKTYHDKEGNTRYFKTKKIDDKYSWFIRVK